jgi:hypothetical protein
MSNEVTRTEYSIVLGDEIIPGGDNLEVVIRSWDSITHQTTVSEGGIQVQSFNTEGNMVRDGWILHISGGRVYLSPTLKGV